MSEGEYVSVAFVASASNEDVRLGVMALATKRMWRDLTARLPEAELGRVRGLLDVMAGRAEPSLQPNQGAMYRLFMPGLPSRPWLDRTDFEDLAGELERAYPELRAEALGEVDHPGAYRPYGQVTGEPDVVYPDNPQGWDELRLWEDLRPTAAVLRMPVTARVLRHITRRSPLLNHVAYLSMKPGTHLQAHSDRANWYVSIHMGIVVPEGAVLRVGDETRPWQEGKCFFFDNSFEHEAWNRGSSTRIILAVYLPHPDLTPVERDAVRLLHIQYQALLAVGLEATAAWALSDD